MQKSTPWYYRCENIGQGDPVLACQDFRLIPGFILVQSSAVAVLEKKKKLNWTKEENLKTHFYLGMNII